MKILKEIRTAAGRLNYYLTESSFENGDIRYGVTVTTTLFGEEESDSVTDFSSDCEKTERFMALMADNSVLPSTLKEVAEEYISAACTV